MTPSRVQTASMWRSKSGPVDALEAELARPLLPHLRRRAQAVGPVDGRARRRASRRPADVTLKSAVGVGPPRQNSCWNAGSSSPLKSGSLKLPPASSTTTSRPACASTPAIRPPPAPEPTMQTSAVEPGSRRERTAWVPRRRPARCRARPGSRSPPTSGCVRSAGQVPHMRTPASARSARSSPAAGASAHQRDVAHQLLARALRPGREAQHMQPVEQREHAGELLLGQLEQGLRRRRRRRAGRCRCGPRSRSGRRAGRATGQRCPPAPAEPRDEYRRSASSSVVGSRSSSRNTLPPPCAHCVERGDGGWEKHWEQDQQKNDDRSQVGHGSLVSPHSGSVGNGAIPDASLEFARRGRDENYAFCRRATTSRNNQLPSSPCIAETVRPAVRSLTTAWFATTRWRRQPCRRRPSRPA